MPAFSGNNAEESWGREKEQILKVKGFMEPRGKGRPEGESDDRRGTKRAAHKGNLPDQPRGFVRQEEPSTPEG